MTSQQGHYGGRAHSRSVSKNICGSSTTARKLFGTKVVFAASKDRNMWHSDTFAYRCILPLKKTLYAASAANLVKSGRLVTRRLRSLDAEEHMPALTTDWNHYTAVTTVKTTNSHLAARRFIKKYKLFSSTAMDTKLIISLPNHLCPRQLDIAPQQR